MKIAILRGPRDLHLEEHNLDTSNLKPDELWIETEISAFKIGTDRGNYEGAEYTPGVAMYPRSVGDSNLGIIHGLGSAVTRFQIGDRVVTRQHHQSEYITNQGASIVKVPADVHSEDAVYAHLYGLSAHCYQKGQFRAGEYVAVIGLGVLGLGAVALGPLFGGRVVALGNSSTRMEMADRMGAHASLSSDDPNLKEKLDAFTDGNGIDLVILAANPWPALKTALDVVRPNGRIANVSLLGRGEPPLGGNPLPTELFYFKGLSLIAVSGPAGYMFPNESDQRDLDIERFSADRACSHMLSLMADGLLEPKRLITHRFNYTELVKAYEMAYHREKSMLGVIFKWKE